MPCGFAADLTVSHELVIAKFTDSEKRIGGCLIRLSDLIVSRA